MQHRLNRPAIITGILLLAILGITAGVFFNSPQNTEDGKQGYPTPAALLENPKPLTPFQLTAHDRKPLNIERLKGKWTLLFFGYTHCPDVCPTTLTELAQAAQQLEPAILKDTQFVFVSVDTLRDTPASLAEYVGYFDPRFIGATGDLESLAVLVRQLESKFSLGKDPAGEPIVNHSSAILLIDPQVRYYAHLVAPHYADEIREQYLALRNYYLKSNSLNTNS
jgi:protein SCO1/2